MPYNEQGITLLFKIERIPVAPDMSQRVMDSVSGSSIVSMYLFMKTQGMIARLIRVRPYQGIVVFAQSKHPWIRMSNCNNWQEGGLVAVLYNLRWNCISCASKGWVMLAPESINHA